MHESGSEARERQAGLIGMGVNGEWARPTDSSARCTL
jgi:hypothetical protein